MLNMKTSVIIAIVAGVAILAVLAGGAAGYFIARNQFVASNVALKTAAIEAGQRLNNRSAMMAGMMRGRMTARMRGDGVDAIGQSRLKYMLEAYAEALDMTADALKEELKSGKSIWDLASAKGIAAEDFDQFMIDAGTSALNKMVADKVITQEQADAMLERMQENWQDVDPETCPCLGEFGVRPRMWRRNAP
jgi:hypothetical protein